MRLIVASLFIMSLICLNTNFVLAKKKLHKNINSKKKHRKLKKFPYEVFIDADSHKVAMGIASYYSNHLHGTLTSTGERYNKYEYSAASNVFPLNTWVYAISIETNDTVKVKINDRMHPNMLKIGRVIDLSYISAKKLHFLNKGLLPIKVITVNKTTN